MNHNKQFKKYDLTDDELKVTIYAN